MHVRFAATQAWRTRRGKTTRPQTRICPSCGTHFGYDDAAGGDRTRGGFGIEVEYGAEAELSRNDLARNPLRLGVFINAVVRWKR